MTNVKLQKFTPEGKPVTVCPGCGCEKVYDPDVWRNYSSVPGSGTVYVCGDCADTPEAIGVIEALRKAWADEAQATSQGSVERPRPRLHDSG